jgi:hypothetical protein
MGDGYLRGALPSNATPAQVKALAAYVAAGGSVPHAAEYREASPRRPARAVATEQLVYRGRAERWLVVPTLESG